MRPTTLRSFSNSLALLALLGCDRGGGPAPAGPSGTGTAAPIGPVATVAPDRSTTLGSVTGAASTTPASARTERPSEPLNVLLVFVDAMRADMPWQGYDRAIAPNLTKLAARSVVYPRYYSVSSYTAKVMGTVLSGRYPSTLYRGATFFTSYSKANLFFPELLQERGIATLSVQAHGYFDSDRGNNLDQGIDVWKVVPGLKWNAETDENVTGPQMTELALALLRDPRHTRGQFFLWLHYMDPHDQYVGHQGVPRFGSKARDLYDGEIYFTDLEVQKLLDFCAAQPWWQRTVLIVLGDHGEAFGEHDQWRHAFTLWDTVTHVPAMVSGPGIRPRRIEARRSHVDLAPTILELMGLPPHPGFVGKSLAAELYGGEPDDREPILLDLPADTYNPPTRAIIKGDLKLLEEYGPRYKLFNLKDDPGERRDLGPVPGHEGELAQMKQLFEQAWSTHSLVLPYGGQKLVGGARASGPLGPPGWTDPDRKDGKK